jgi:hypothetical protein
MGLVHFPTSFPCPVELDGVSIVYIFYVNNNYKIHAGRSFERCHKRWRDQKAKLNAVLLWVSC